ncbi:MAG: SLC13 family permease [Woeseiaceae bacterium]|nr:SLC13 family permease [Woeseiaceae bacterium]
MPTTTPDAHGFAVLLLTVVALVLFTRDRLALETSSLIVLILLIAGFHLFPYQRNGETIDAAEFFLGFGNEALVAVCALMIVGKSLETTGALLPVATLVSRAWSARPLMALIVTLVAAAILSAFVNNTPIVVLLLPILIGVSLRAKFPASDVMLPMGFATLIGGMATTIGTSTNLLVVGISEDLGLAPFGMFDFALPVVIVGSGGILFLWLAAPKMLPLRKLPMDDMTPRVFDSQLSISEDSFANGKTLAEVLARTDGQMRVDRIQRTETLFLAKLPSVVLQPGDRLFVKDTPENLKHYENLLGATLYNIADIEHPVDEDTPLDAADQQLAEIVVTRDSFLERRTLGNSGLASGYRLLPLAIHRASWRGRKMTGDLNSIRLRAGDVLLVQGSRASIDLLKARGDVLVLDGTMELPRTHRAKRALVVMAFVIGAAAIGLMPIAISAVIGVGLLFACGCLDWRRATDALSTQVIMIIVASLALGKALVATGMADYLANGYAGMVSGMPVPLILSSLILILAVLTNIVSNNAAAVIGTPIAVGIASHLGEDPIPFVLAVLFGANLSFATPFGYKTNLLILSAGGYKFSDFVRVGVPLTIITWLGFSIVLPLWYPAQAGP